MSQFAYFRDTTTGKVGEYPYAFAALFPNLVEVSEKDAECVDCWKSDDPVVEQESEQADSVEGDLDPIYTDPTDYLEGN